MRQQTDKSKVNAFMRELGRRAKGPGRVYLVGGSTALLLDIRPSTLDIDLKLDPEPTGVFEAIAEIKEQLSVNIELAAPDQFLPPLPGWQDRSELVGQGWVEIPVLINLFERITPMLNRYPSLDPDDFTRKVKAFAERFP